MAMHSIQSITGGRVILFAGGAFAAYLLLLNIVAPSRSASRRNFDCRLQQEYPPLGEANPEHPSQVKPATAYV
jgi:hypothetical protein